MMTRRLSAVVACLAACLALWAYGAPADVAEQVALGEARSRGHWRSVGAASGDSGSISGSVTDAQTANPIPGAWIIACDEWNYYEATTGPDGSYSMSDIAAGCGYTVCAWAGGYGSSTAFDVCVGLGETTIVDLSLDLSPPPPGAGTISSPYWHITLDDFGYSDWMIQTYPGQWEHENLSGEWAAAIRYNGIATSGGESMWLPPYFTCPFFATNSTFHTVNPIAVWDDPANPTPGYDTGQSKISNGVVDITISYRMEQTQDGMAVGLRPAGVGDATPRLSGPYVLLITYEITNISPATLADLSVYQFLHAHPNDNYGPSNYAVYDPTDYQLGAFPEFRYRTTQYGVSLWNPPGSDLTGFSASRPPDAWGIGQFPGHGGEPAEGLHLNVYADTLPCNGSGGPAEIASTMKWHFGSLAPGMSVTHTVVLWNGWLDPQVPSAVVDSPYPSTDDWLYGSWHRHIGQLHAHYMPDGEYFMDAQGNVTGVRYGWFMSPPDLVRKYQEEGYGFVAVTEHHPDWKFDQYTWQWVFADPGVSGTTSLMGSVEDTGANHILGIGFGQDIDQDTMGWGFTDEDRLSNIRDAGGLAFFAHPDFDEYPVDSYELYRLRGRYDGFELYNMAVYAAAWLKGGAWSWAALDQAYAVDTWDFLLRTGSPEFRTTWGIAGDDFTPNDGQGWAWFDDACVVVWTPSPSPDREEIKEALRAGRCYACKGGSRAPEVAACWVDPSASAISVLVSAPYEVTFVPGRWGRQPVKQTAVQIDTEAYLASYSYFSDDVYVRAEVRDTNGSTAWLQPIWIDRMQSAQCSVPFGSVSAAQAEPLVLSLEGAQLTVSTPQAGIDTLYGRLVPGRERPPGPPMGYLSLCYEFSPDGALGGSNLLSVRYLPDSVRGFPASALALYRYDLGAETWTRLPSDVDEYASTVTAAITRLGVFTVSAEPPEDIGPPTVTITAPAAGATISAPTTVTAEAYHDLGVARVRFYLDGWPIGTDDWAGDGWEILFDPAEYTTGARRLIAVAEDGVGNEAAAEVEVTVVGEMSQPAIAIASPTAGEVLWGDLTASGEWTGELPMTLGKFLLDDEPVTTSPPTDSTWEISVPVQYEQAGDRVFTATGFDIYGNRAEASVPVVIRVFPDVPLGFWSWTEIYAIARAGIVQGYPDGTYQPDAAVTRGQMAIYISRALAGGDEHVPSGPALASFPDVPSDDVCYKHIEYAHANQIVFGYQDGCYWPAYKVDRGTMAVFVARATAVPVGESGMADYVPPATPTFADVTQQPSDPYAVCYPYVEYIAEQGVTHGYPDGLYHPEYVVSRGLMAIYVARAFGLD